MIKRVLFLFVVAAMSIISVKAQCTPDLTLTTPDILPKELKSGTLNSSYEQIIQYFMNKDTTVDVMGTSQKATIDSLYVTYVLGLPKGLTFNCHNPVCGIAGNQNGCVRLYGTPTEAGTFPIMVILTIKATITIPFIGNINRTILDTNSHYSILISKTSGIPELVASKQAQVFPNPTSEAASFRCWGTTNETVVMETIDIQGKLVSESSHDLHMGENAFFMETAHLPAGMYVTRFIQSDGTKISAKWIKQ